MITKHLESLELSIIAKVCIGMYSRRYVEYNCEGMYEEGCPNPKCSCKGIQQKRTQISKGDFKEFLTGGSSKIVEKAGFMCGKDGTIKTYTQIKSWYVIHIHEV